ncbi:cAMP-binding domain of CRP or a regulatory subunit of cAMP-dependent protein kinases [Filomicrobium insigne]|uniref:cAMP-binding domain of CRP or a regulatory subunit of cAMP-dependent protein kinases n=2 Tax=Filomicrobium TaxID=119044 RepID=A0A1H0I7Y1_9HYPH|nr:cAMP-binding domain of CRP or a regulatory subunit of cAMP-dependent protein kinases [Filomicrobium insigne]
MLIAKRGIRVDHSVTTGASEPYAIRNNLLRSLKRDDLMLLEPFLQEMHGETGAILAEPGDPVQYAYFPCGPALASFVIVMDDGRAVETALIGREGAVGGIVSQGRLPAYARAIVQFPGPFLRISIGDLEYAKARSLTLRYLFARYADCLLAQVFQSVACNAAHSIEQRTVKWLLAAIDRTGDHQVPLTQEQLAGMLGVGRSYVSRVMQSLRASGLLETRRGSVCIRDAERLASLSCGCNDALKRHFDLVLAGVYPTCIESTAQRLAMANDVNGSNGATGAHL